MHDAVSVDVIEYVQNAQGDAQGSLRREFLFPIEDLAQQAAIHPLHDHVDLAAVLVGEDFHDAGMVHGFADLFFAAETIEKGRITLHFRVGDLDGDLAPCGQVGAAKNGGHSAASGQSVNLVVIELLAGMD